MSEPRVIRQCAGPGCPTLIDSGGNGRKIYCGPPCNDRAYRARVAERAAELGTRVRANLTILSTPTGDDRTDAQIGRKWGGRASAIDQLKPSARRVLRLLDAAGDAGQTTHDLCQPQAGGIRFSARVAELRDAGLMIAQHRVRNGSHRYWLARESMERAA